MGNVTVDITMSLDGYVAGPNMSRENPIGEGAGSLHAWLLKLATFGELHGGEGSGETGPDDDVLKEAFAGLGATVMGRRMFGGGEGEWGSDPTYDDPWQGWWGDDPPFHGPVFVLTHHPREPIEMQGGTTFHFVSEGIKAAVEQARAAAADKDVSVGGGASTIQQALAAGLVDEMQIHVVPQLLGEGKRLLDNIGSDLPGLKITRVIDSPAVTHIKYRVAKQL